MAKTQTVKFELDGEILEEIVKVSKEAKKVYLAIFVFRTETY